MQQSTVIVISNFSTTESRTNVTCVRVRVCDRDRVCDRVCVTVCMCVWGGGGGGGGGLAACTGSNKICNKICKGHGSKYPPAWVNTHLDAMSCVTLPCQTQLPNLLRAHLVLDVLNVIRQNLERLMRDPMWRHVRFCLMDSALGSRQTV